MKTNVKIIVFLLLGFMLIVCNQKQPSPTFEQKIHGMLMASAVADAMAGPHEGKSTADSRAFLQQGRWIDSFDEYTVWHFHHWNVYTFPAPPGTVTDDDRMRLETVDFMIDYGKQYKGPMSRYVLADYVIQRYIKARKEFVQIDEHYQANPAPDSVLVANRKSKFLAMWYAWEIFKTATSEFIPDPPVMSPPYKRISDDPYYGEYSPSWSLNPVMTYPVTRNLKSTYHFRSYTKGHVMPLGLIHLLPLAAYFPGEPQDVYQYILKTDFMDIKEGPLFVATACAILADLLGGRSWPDISKELKKNKLADYVGVKSKGILNDMDRDIKKAIQLGREYADGSVQERRDKVNEFIFQLQSLCAIDEPIMCTVQEMLYTSIALMEFSHDNLPLLIETGVNYGRDNDTMASIAATFGGAANGIDAVPADWQDIVRIANPVYDFAGMSQQLADILMSK